MRVRLIDFGEIEVEGTRYDYDVVIDQGTVSKRKKKASKPYRDRFGHTPLSVGENIPWGGNRLIIGTGVNGALPIMPEVYAEAEERGIEIVALPTPQACQLLSDLRPREVRAVLHITC